MSVYKSLDRELIRHERTVDAAVQAAATQAGQLAELRHSSGADEAHLNGEYNEDHEFTEYFVAGGIVGVNPLDPG